MASIIVSFVISITAATVVWLILNYTSNKDGEAYSIENLTRLFNEKYQQGRNKGYTDGFEDGAKHLKQKYINFMEETLLMVKNDELELIEVITNDDETG